MSKVSRRDFIVKISAAAAAFACAPFKVSAYSKTEAETRMYGLISKINITPGKREELIAILLEGVSHMPGCLSYVVAKDSTDENAIWVAEVWENRAKHKESLSLPSVQKAMAEGRPLITGFGERIETVPVGGYGLVTGETQ